ncbi:MAG: cytochrome c3 family protein [Thermodesulfobacteriota bacterium]
MEKRGRSVLALVLGLAVAVAAASMVFAANKMPDKDLTIDTQNVYEKKTKSPVVFPHAKHKALKCMDCHHVYKDAKNVFKEGDEVQKCGSCHKAAAQDKAPGLKDAFHKQCEGCHKKMKKDKQKTGPTACTKCHPKKEGEKDNDK